jgi:tetratricopeptide (TPR) repeat protein
MAAEYGPLSPLLLGFMGCAYARGGQIDEARKLLQELEELGKNSYVPALSFASIYGALGEIDESLNWLEKAIDEHDSLIAQFHVNPYSDPLRSHPRYEAVLRKMNLEP